MAGRKKYFDLRYMFMRGLMSHERMQRSRHYLKSAAECTSKAIVSLELSEKNINTAKQALRLESIGPETVRRLEGYVDSKAHSSERPAPGRYISSAGAILVALLSLSEKAAEDSQSGVALIPEQELHKEAARLCVEKFLPKQSPGFCQAWWRLEVLIKRDLVKRRSLQKANVYHLLPLGREAALALRARSLGQDSSIADAATKPSSPSTLTTPATATAAASASKTAAATPKPRKRRGKKTETETTNLAPAEKKPLPSKPASSAPSASTAVLSSVTAPLSSVSEATVQHVLTDAMYSSDTGQDGVVLLVDIQECGGNRAGLAELCEMIEQTGTAYRTRKLPCADYAWIWRCEGVERQLPFLLERKRADDVAYSLKDGRFWGQISKMGKQREELQNKGVEATLQYIVEGKPENFVVRCADGCQGVGRCGNPTLTQVQRVLGDLKQHPHLELIRVDSILDTVRHLAVITSQLNHRCERGEFDQLIIAEMTTVTPTIAKISATQGKPVTATIVKSEDPVFIIDDENDDENDSCHVHSQNVEAAGKNFSRKSSSITRSQEQMELDGHKNLDDREFCADKKESSWSLHSSAKLGNADVHSKRQPGDWRFSDKDSQFQREGNDIDWKGQYKNSNEEPSYPNKSSHSVKLEEEGFTGSPPLLLPALAKPPQADVNTESRSVGQSGRRQAQQESGDLIGSKSPSSTAGGREKLTKRTGAESSLNSSLGQRKSVNDSSCKTKLPSHSADESNLVSNSMEAKQWTRISPVMKKNAEYSPGENDLNVDSQEPQTWSCLSPYKGNYASKPPSDGELVFESKRAKRWTEGVPFTNCSLTYATGKSSTIPSSISPGREDSARHFEHKDNSHKRKRSKTEGSNQHIDDDGKHTLVEKKTECWLFEDGDSDSGGGSRVQTAKAGGGGSKLSGLTLFPRVSFDLHHKNGRDATSGNWSSPSKSGCHFSDLTPAEPASGDRLLGGHLDPLKKRRSSASGYTEGGSVRSCPDSAAFLDAEWFDKTSSNSGGSSTSGATAAKTTECSGLKREFTGSPVTKVSTRCKSPELRKKSRVTYKTEDMSPVSERVRGREAVTVALSNFHDRSDSEDSDSLPDIDLGVCPSRPPSFNAPPSLPGSVPGEGWEREATPSHGGSNSQEGVIAGALSRAGNGGADDELGDKITQIAAVFPQMKGRQIADLLRHFGGDIEGCVTAILEDPGLMGRQEMATSSNPTPPSTTTTTSFIATASSSGGSINAFIDLTD